MFTARHGVNVAIIGDKLYVIGGHVQAAGTGGEAANTDATRSTNSRTSRRRGSLDSLRSTATLTGSQTSLSSG